jgi:hypothetical protein
MIYHEPIVNMVSSKIEGDKTIAVIRFNSLPSDPLVPASLCDENKPEHTYVKLFNILNRKGNTVTLLANSAVNLQPGGYIYRTWWSPKQLAIAQSNPDEWQIQYFESSDSLAFHLSDGSVATRKRVGEEKPEGAKVINGGWYHQHCSLCWKTISEQLSDEHRVYVKKSDWVCEDCFSKYIKSGYGKTIKLLHNTDD